ncbi:hypothetical protein [Falsirhodobacter sp. 20TX0035]|uniref:hypothetical protein n=1 Tax=Falsirhodobacter sp. 20TX0035 TaxID=3022019 RepID=UPI00232D48C0|nr:hypothetical protein [Falsirhodobacter sp. 20TX0035]MDB6454734.1 hypothetical protein [Falsirhodobacter sp. 20TX0035]
MTDAERIEQLERDLNETLEAALTIIVGMADAIAPSAEAKEDLARGFAAAAEGQDGAIPRLSRAVADLLIRVADEQ